jgi:hypothetical protein
MTPANHHQHPPNLAYIVKLNPADVVLGRGAGPNEHSGNIAFREIVLDLKPSYIATVNRKMKSYIATKVVKAIRARGGRFLKRASGRVDDVFVLAEEDVVVEKAKQALRHGRCTVKPRKGRVSSVSSLSSSSTTSSAASHSLAAVSPLTSRHDAAILLPNPVAPTPSPAAGAATATRESNLLTMTLLAQQRNAIVSPVARETVTVSKGSPPISSCPRMPALASNLRPALQDSSYQLTLQVLMALAESKRLESSTAECLQLIELAEVLVAAQSARGTAVKTSPAVTPEASFLPCNLIAQLLLSQHQEQQNSLLSPSPSFVIPTSFGESSGINAQLLNASKLSLHSLPKAI